jgi:hypothetical protein
MEVDDQLGGSQSQSGYWRDEKNLALPGIEPQPFNEYPVAILTELTRPQTINTNWA